MTTSCIVEFMHKGNSIGYSSFEIPSGDFNDIVEAMTDKTHSISDFVSVKQHGENWKNFRGIFNDGIGRYSFYMRKAYCQFLNGNIIYKYRAICRPIGG